MGSFSDKSSVFVYLQTIDNGLAPPLLTYADLLMTADDRNLETAELIYDQYIARLVE